MSFKKSNRRVQSEHSNTKILDGDVDSSAAIAGTKINPAFGSQNVSTTGTLSSGAATVTSIKDTGLSTGVVHSDSSGNFTSSAVNLASADVTGVLPTGNQAAQSITGITGDASFTGTTASGTATLATVNSNVGTFGSTTTIPVVTVNGKGLVTAVSTASVTSGINQLTGDATAGPGTGSQAITFATVNSNTGTFGNGTHVGQFTVNAKGLITAASSVAITGAAPTGAAGGDLSNNYPNPTVAKIQGNPVASTTLGATQDGYIAQWNNSNNNIQFNKVSGDISISNTGATTLNNIDGYSLPNPGNQQGVLQSNNGTLTWTQTPTLGSITVTGLKDTGLSTGVVHSDSSGNFTSSTIVNTDVSSSAAINYSKLSLSNSIVNGDINSSAAIAYSKLSLTGSVVNGDISSSAAIAVSKLAAGTSAQVLLNNATPSPTWTSITGDVSLTNAGATTVTALQGNAVQSGALGASQDGYVLTWKNASSQWQAKPAAGGSSVTWANDLVNSTSTNQYVSSLSYSSSSAGGAIAINGTGTTLQFAAGNTAPAITQSTQTSNTSAANLKFTPQAPYASATGANVVGGNIVFNTPAPIGGTSQVPGYIDFQYNGTSYGGVQIINGSTTPGIISGYATTLFLGESPLAYNATSSGLNNKSWIAGNGSGLFFNGAGNYNFYANGSSGGSTLFTSTSTFFAINSGDFKTTAGNTYLSTGQNQGAWCFSAGSNQSGGVSGTCVIFPNQSSYASPCLIYANSQTKSANYTLLLNNLGNNDHIIYADTSSASGAFTLTLPSTPVLGLTYKIKDSSGAASTKNVTISGNGKNIDGSSTYVLNLNYAMIELIYNGTQWNVIGSYNGTVI